MNNRPSLISTQRRLFVEGAGLQSSPLTHRRYRPQARRFTPAGFCLLICVFVALMLDWAYQKGERRGERDSEVV